VASEEEYIGPEVTATPWRPDRSDEAWVRELADGIGPLLAIGRAGYPRPEKNHPERGKR
jgi:hypothetical protein